MSKNKTILFGKHLTIDAYGCDAKVLADLEVVFRFLDELPGKIAMKKIAPPYLVRFEGNDKKDCGGITGMVMIAESHIAIHTFPAKQYLTMDVYSCAMFDENKVLKITKDTFKYKILEKKVIKRGLKFPKNNLISPNPMQE